MNQSGNENRTDRSIALPQQKDGNQKRRVYGLPVPHLFFWAGIMGSQEAARVKMRNGLNDDPRSKYVAARTRLR